MFPADGNDQADANRVNCRNSSNRSLLGPVSSDDWQRTTITILKSCTHRRGGHPTPAISLLHLQATMEQTSCPLDPTMTPLVLAAVWTSHPLEEASSELSLWGLPAAVSLDF